jgi:hypothetical protein
MKIWLNQRIQYLSQSFHKGELSLSDYRSLRREEFEHLNNLSNGHDSRHAPSIINKLIPAKQVLKRAGIATLLAVSLLILTVMLVRFLF